MMDGFEIIDRSHLVRRVCACSAVALADAEYAGIVRCGACLRALADRATAMPAVDPWEDSPSWLSMLGQGYPVRAALVADQYPSPEITSREPWDGAGVPLAVAKRAESAVAARWDVRVQRSRGCAPNAANGRPGVVKTRFALVLGNGYASAYAVHDGSSWKSIMLWSAERPWFPLATVTDLGEYIAAGGKMNDEWFDAIRRREAEKKRSASQ